MNFQNETLESLTTLYKRSQLDLQAERQINARLERLLDKERTISDEYRSDFNKELQLRHHFEQQVQILRRSLEDAMQEIHHLRATLSHSHATSQPTNMNVTLRPGFHNPNAYSKFQ